MIASLNRRGWHYFLLVVVSLLMFFLNLGGASLWDLDEGRNATCAMEMLASGNWIVPTYNGELRVDKPVLLYWLQIGSYSCFGINEFAARFPSAVAALLTVLCAYELGRSMFSRTTGILAGVILATTPMQCAAGRFANPDALLNLFTVLALTIFWIGLKARRDVWFGLLGAACGMAFLAKGPVGLALPGAVGALFLLWDRQGRAYLDWRWLIAGLSFVVTAVPWYVWVGIETKGAFLSGFFVKHNFERGVSVMDAHPGFPGFYMVVLLVGTAPWSLFLALSWWFGLWSAVRTPWTSCRDLWISAADSESFPSAATSDDRPAAYRLLLAWILVYVAFFSVAATKLPNYVLPAVLPCAILIGRYLERWHAHSVRLPAWMEPVQLALLVLGGGALSLAMLAVGGVGELPVLRSRFIPGLERWAFVGLIPIALGAAGWWFLRKRQPERFTTAMAIGAVLMFAPFAAYGLAVFNDCKAPAPLVEQANAYRPRDDIRVGALKLSHLASLNFYVKRQVSELENESAVVEFLDAGIPVFLVLSSQNWEKMSSAMPRSARIVGRHYDFYQNRELVVVTNR